MTINLLIGNTDNKLTQQEWAEFVKTVGLAVSQWSDQIHFSGASAPCAPWQNAAWTIEASGARLDLLKQCLANIAARFNQDSVAWLEGDTQFIRPAMI